MHGSLLCTDPFPPTTDPPSATVCSPSVVTPPPGQMSVGIIHIFNHRLLTYARRNLDYCLISPPFPLPMGWGVVELTNFVVTAIRLWLNPYSNHKKEDTGWKY